MGQAESRQEQFWEACGFGHTSKVKKFLEEGVDVNWVSKTHDSSPIHVASQGKTEIVKLLIDAGCDVNARDERQCTALHHASMNGYADCAKLLLEAGAIVNVEDKNKWTPLHCAAYWGHPEVTKLLLLHKADVTIFNKDGRSALHEVARSKSKNEHAVGITAEALIQAGSDVESRAGADGFNEFTVLMFASYHGHVSVVEHLLEARCEINAQSSNKWTALHWAADRSHINVVELLLENGADTSLLGNRSESAKDRAVSDDVKEIFNKYSYINSTEDESKTKAKCKHHQMDDGSNLPDFTEFPSHLQENEPLVGTDDAKQSPIEKKEELQQEVDGVPVKEAHTHSNQDKKSVDETVKTNLIEVQSNIDTDADTDQNQTDNQVSEERDQFSEKGEENLSKSSDGEVITSNDAARTERRLEEHEPEEQLVKNVEEVLSPTSQSDGDLQGAGDITSILTSETGNKTSDPASESKEVENGELIDRNMTDISDVTTEDTLLKQSLLCGKTSDVQDSLDSIEIEIQRVSGDASIKSAIKSPPVEEAGCSHKEAALDETVS